jgi:hypothetical protein
MEERGRERWKGRGGRAESEGGREREKGNGKQEGRKGEGREGNQEEFVLARSLDCRGRGRMQSRLAQLTRVFAQARSGLATARLNSSIPLAVADPSVIFICIFFSLYGVLLRFSRLLNTNGSLHYNLRSHLSPIPSRAVTCLSAFPRLTPSRARSTPSRRSNHPSDLSDVSPPDTII